MTTPPEIIRDTNGFMLNWDEFDAWARDNHPVWHQISLSMRGRSETERLMLLAAHLLTENTKLIRDMVQREAFGGNYTIVVQNPAESNASGR